MSRIVAGDGGVEQAYNEETKELENEVLLLLLHLVETEALATSGNYWTEAG